MKELLQGYTVEVLRRKPPDLVEFAVQHFTQILDVRRKELKAKRPSGRGARKGVSFESKSNKADVDLEEEEDNESECHHAFLPWGNITCSNTEALGPGDLSSHLKDEAPQKVFPSCGSKAVQFLSAKPLSTVSTQINSASSLESEEGFNSFFKLFF